MQIGAGVFFSTAVIPDAPTGPREARPDDRLRGDPESSPVFVDRVWMPGSRPRAAPRNEG
jgi:hypothetical protein